jgi:hypothetical protein
LVFQPGDNPVLPVTNDAFNTQTYTYMYLRVLPADSQIAGLAPSWDNVHNYVLSNPSSTVGAMSRLGNPQKSAILESPKLKT